MVVFLDSEPSILGVGWTEAEVRHFVGECYDRDTNLNVLLGFSETCLEKRMILILGKKILQPFMIQGWADRSPEALKSARVARGDIPTTLGKYDGESYAALFDALELQLEPELFVIPIPIGNRITTMILGVPSDENCGLNQLSEIAKFVGMQLEKLIRLSKNGELPPKGERIPASPIRSKDSDVSNETLQAYVLAATEIDVPIVPKLAEHTSEGDIRKTLTLGNGLGIVVSSEAEDASPFRIVSEASEGTDRDDNEVASTSFGLPLIAKGGEISFVRRTSVDNEDVETFAKVEAEIVEVPKELAFDTEINFQSSARTSSEASTGVAIMIPKQITEEAAHATLMGGIGVASELVEKSLRETTANTAIVAPIQSLKRRTPGAAIFRARKKAGKVGGFIPQSTKNTPAIPVETVIRESLQKASITREAPVIKKVSGIRETAEIAIQTPTAQTETEVPAANVETAEIPAVQADVEIPVLIIPESRHTIELDEFPDGGEKRSTVASDKETNPQLPADVVSNMKRKLADTAELQKWDIKDDSEDIGEWADNDVLDPAVFDNLTPTGELSSVVKSIIQKSGPSVMENQEYFMMIDSRDSGVAFSAAEKIATLGQPALPFLNSIFPGRIFIDRYQFTAETMPNASLHTPVLDCLSRLGSDAALEVPMNYLDDKSTETRFYAVFLLTNFDCGDRISEIYERFFDKDQQIQNVAKLVLTNAKETDGFRAIIDRLRNEIQFSQKDYRLEIACDILAIMKDRKSVELFIDLLEEQTGRTQTRIHHALQVLTLKDLSTPYEWRQWWRDANSEPRSEWLIAALDSNSEFIRKSAFNELQRIPGLSLNYHTMQPSKLRRRAQRELRSWFDSLR